MGITTGLLSHWRRKQQQQAQTENSSRSDPLIALARLCTQGQLVELRTADLLFTSEEAAALLREVWGFSLPEENIATLVERTEGWATGCQLAAL